MVFVHCLQKFRNALFCITQAFYPIKNLLKRIIYFFTKNVCPFFLKSAKVIVTDSQFSKNYIIQQYKTDEQK